MEAAGADCMDASVQAFHQIACAHAAHGTTALVATTMTCEDPLLERVIACYLEAERTQYTGAQLLGLHLEGPFFSAGSPNARGAQPVTRNRTPSREELERIISLGQGRILRWDASPGDRQYAALCAGDAGERDPGGGCPHAGGCPNGHGRPMTAALPMPLTFTMP